MPLQSYDSLNALHMDVLQEIGNIGAGNSLAALSTMISSKVDMTPPKVRILSFAEAVESSGGAENVGVGILLTLSGDINGMIMFIIEENFAHKMVNLLLSQALLSFEDNDEMSKSALCEIGNIMGASFINAIATMTGMAIDISTPSLAIDMMGAILSVPAIIFGEVGDKVLFIEEEFTDSVETIKSRVALIPDVESLNKILTRLGIE
ncbi:MAG: chemotaxis protein CheC [Oscillospiraceae bacterium]